MEGLTLKESRLAKGKFRILLFMNILTLFLVVTMGFSKEESQSPSAKLTVSDVSFSKTTVTPKEMIVEPIVPTQPTVEVSKYTSLDTSYNRGLLARLIAAEYRSQKSEDLNKKVAIGIVVLNRVLSESFPNTVEGVIFQKNQFQPTFDGSWEKVNPTDFDKLAVQKAFEGQTITTEDGKTMNDALYFLNPDISEQDNVQWFKQNLSYVGTLGEHEFYSEK